jgi:hypothetical protein
MLIIQSLFGLKSRHTLVRDTYRKDMRSTHPEGGQPPSIHRSSIYSYSIAAQQRKRGALQQSTRAAFKVTLFWSIWWGSDRLSNLYSQVAGTER